MFRQLNYSALAVQQKLSSLIIIQRNSFAANSMVLSKEKLNGKMSAGNLQNTLAYIYICGLTEVSSTCSLFYTNPNSFLRVALS
jgi:hypothetical protein